MLELQLVSVIHHVGIAFQLQIIIKKMIQHHSARGLSPYLTTFKPKCKCPNVDGLKLQIGYANK